MRTILARSITARMLVIGGVLALLLSGAFAVLIVAVGNQRDAGRQALRIQEAITAGTQLERSAISMEAGLRGFVASGRTRALEPFNAARKVYPDQVRQLQHLIADDPRQQATVRRISAQIADYVNLWALPLLSISRDRINVARSIVVNTTGRQRIDAVRSSFLELFSRERSVAAARERAAERRSNVATLLGGLGIALVVIITMGMALYLRRAMIRPALAVANATDAVAAGDLSTRVPVERADEMGKLARGFNAMTASLQRGREQLGQRTAELERSNRDLEDYASVASHDLQGPLSTISMYSELLVSRLRDRSDDDAELAARVGLAAQRMRTLVRDLLTYSRLDRSQMRWDEVELDEVMRTALDNLAGPIAEHGADVSAEALPVVRGDSGQLCQVIQNLVSNAVKFTEGDSPVVRVCATAAHAEARVSVIDNGIGIDPEHAQRIFRPFQRLHSSDRYEGSGIGLAICERIVSRHGGRIWAEGTPGAGSTFHFTVPLVRPAAGPGDPAEAAPAARATP